MDREIADRMRNENAEQFQTLVRMHLSFELDLNTDPVEWVVYQLLLRCVFQFLWIHNMTNVRFVSSNLHLS